MTLSGMPPGNRDVEVEQVIAGFLRGDSAQFQIIRRQISRLVDLWYSARTAEREDLVADTLKSLLENLQAGQFQGTTLKSLNSYIYGMTRFKVMRAVQRARHNAPLPDAEVLETLPAPLTGDQHREAAHRQLLAKIYAALNPTCRELLTLKFALGWSDQEIADHRKMTKNAVSTAVSRCIRRAQTLDFVREILYQKPPYGHYEE